MMSGNHWWMFGGPFMWLIWIVVIVGIVFLVKWIVQKSRPSASGSKESALETLKNRYAKGEIGKEEFEEKKKDLLS